MSEPATELVERVRALYGLEVRSVRPLLGGYDVWARSWCLDSDRGPLVLRVDRAVSVQTAPWLADVVAGAAAAGVPCPAPIAALDGTRAFAAGGATVTVRPFAEGVVLDRDDSAQVAAAGATLGLLHRALADFPRRRPTPSPWAACRWPGDRDPPALRDPALDRWEAAFRSKRAYVRGVVHGDFYAENLLWCAGGVNAVIDFSEARVDAHVEFAWATWEFGHDGTSSELEIDRARTFLTGYHEVAGSWEPGTAEVLVPLMRIEMRLNARYSLDDPEDAEYGTALQRAFTGMAGQSAIPLLD